MTKTQTTIIVLALVAVAAFLALRPRRAHPLEVGDFAPGFTLPGLILPHKAGTAVRTSGGSEPGIVHLSDYRHQVVLVNFWASWCPPCVEEAASLESFAEQMGSHGVTVIGVSVDQDTSALEKFLAEHHTTFPIARDPEQVLAGRYGTSKFPETYILDRDGRVAEKIIGFMDWQDPRIISYVRELAGGNERASR